MERISSVETDTGWHPEKCEVNKDFISDLPDTVLMHILSFLPLKDAIKTVLLRRFGKMWLDMPFLDLDNCAYHKYTGRICDIEHEKFMDMIRQVCNHHSDAKLDKVRLNLTFSPTPSYTEKEKNAADQIEKMICYAISRKVKVLDLNFIGCFGFRLLIQYYEVPDVFRSNHLIELHLASCDILSFEKLNLPALKVLSLYRVALPDEVMAKLLQCLNLEDLSVDSCGGFCKLNCENPNLKKLKIDLNGEEHPLYISCPHVVSLEISGWIERAKLLDVSSSLVDATINYSDHYLRYTERSYADVLMLLLDVHLCKNFSAGRGGIMVLSIWELTESLCLPHFNWKNITLKLDLTKWYLPGLSLLLKNSPHVEALDLHIWNPIRHFLQDKRTKWIMQYDFDEENYWDSQVATFPCLETITLHVDVYEPNLIRTVKFLLKNAPRLEKMVIISTIKTLDQEDNEEQNDTKEQDDTEEQDDIEEQDDTEVQNGLSSEQLLELSIMLLMLPKASSRAMIHFREI